MKRNNTIKNFNWKNNVNKTIVTYLLILKTDIYGNESKLYSKNDIICEYKKKDIDKFIEKIKKDGYTIYIPYAGCETIKYDELRIVKQIKNISTKYWEL